MKRVFAFLIAVMMLATNVGATINTHICGGKTSALFLSIGATSLSCGMDEMSNGCANDSGNSFSSKSCCDNQSLLLSVDDNSDIPAVEITKAQFQMLACFVESYANIYQDAFLASPEYKDYAPPLLNPDIPVLIQSFLI